MKRLAILIFILHSSLFVFHSFAQKEARITLDLKGVQTEDSVTMSWGTFNKPTSPLILQVQANEKQTIRIPLNEPRLIIVGLKGYSGGYELLASPDEEITLSGRIRKDKSGRRPKVDFPRMTITGAKWQTPYQNAVAEYLFHLDSLNASMSNDFRDIQKFIRKAKEEKNEQSIADMYQTMVGHEYIERVMGNYANMKDFYRTVVLKQRDSFLAPMLMLRFGGNIDKSQQGLYDALSEPARQSYYGREVKDLVYPPTMIGNIAPTVTVKNKEGENKLLSFIHQTNRYLLLDFWASWCEPCLNEVPNLKRLYEQYHDKGLDIIGLSVDRSIDDWKETLEEMDEPWCNYIDIDKQAIMEYQVLYIPCIFIMDSNGKIIAEKLRGKDLSDFIDKLFAE